ncbi:MAG: acyl-CoA synthetase (AMP-forming)/AMP-acid ligase [Firmicutes bacterium]|nr:acyl-CoA synthetase (AMP-forming)/AMP-acid ligase [Bacillota bacterium]
MERMNDGYFISLLSMYKKNISPDREVLYDYDSKKHYTYGMLEDRANRLAHFLIRQGMRKGDRVGFCSYNCVEFIDAFFASCKTGIIITSYNCHLKEEKLLELIRNEAPKALLYDENFADVIDAAKRSCPDIIFISVGEESQKHGSYSYAQVQAEEITGPIDCKTLTLDDIQMLIHTGGTTGTPKAAKISYRSLISNVLSQILTVGLNQNDIAYVFLPFFHTAAWTIFTLPLLLIGGKVIITKRFDADLSLKIIAEEHPTLTIGVETALKRLAEAKKFKETDFSSYRIMISGAAPIARETMEHYWKKGVKLVSGYGMTELGTCNLLPPVNDMKLEQIKEKWDSVGKPLLYNSVRIVDSKGNDVEPGEPGELIWQGELVFSGYWNNESQTREMVRDGWIYSGDIGRMGPDGYYYIVGRNKDIFISGGENIFPGEIEEVLCKHPAVEEACVIGVSDVDWGEVGKALLVPKDCSNLNRRDILEFVRGRLPSIKIPKYFEFIDEIPKNQVGKRDMERIKAKYNK